MLQRSPTFEQPLVCPVTVGRGDTLRVLDRIVEQTSHGSGQILLVSGEAGVGKSRLVAEARARAARLGLTLLQGSCFEPDRAVPYAPILDLLRQLPEGDAPPVDGSRPAPGTPEHALLDQLPQLVPLLADLVTMPPAEPGQEQGRLIRALAHFFDRQAARTPLLIVIEDIHWSDDSSLEFLQYLARQVGRQPIVLLLTYRSDEVHPTLRHFLAEYDRQRLAVELRLDRLTHDETGQMIRAIVGSPHPIRATFVQAVYAMTDGNPFFVEEVLKSLATMGHIDQVVQGGAWAGGGRDAADPAERPGEARAASAAPAIDRLPIPRSVQDAVYRRMERLSHGARQTLTLASVAGRRFDFAVLQALQACDEAELLRRIRELIGAQMVVEESAERFAFRHALTRQAIYADLLGRERKAMHLAIAQAVERRYGNAIAGHLPDLAAHYFEAGVWERALEYARRAGEQAQRLFAPRAAVEHYSRALEAARQLSMVPSPELYRVRGAAYEASGDFERARADHEMALTIARATGARTAEWQALSDLGVLWTSRNYERAAGYLDEALALARELGDLRALAHSLTQLGNCHGYQGDPETGIRHFEAALATFEQLGDGEGVASTLDSLGVFTQVAGDLAASARYHQRALPLLRQQNRRPALARALAIYSQRAAVQQVSTMVSQAPLDVCIPDAREAVDVARSIGWPSVEVFATVFLGILTTSRGRFGEALTLLRGALELAEAIEHHSDRVLALSTLGLLYGELLADELAADHQQQAIDLAERIDFTTLATGGSAYLASQHTAEGRLDAAAAAIDRGLAAGTPPPVISLRQLRCAQAELELARGNSGGALAITQELLATVPGATGDRAIPRLAYLRGRALLAQRRFGAAESELGAALRAASEQGTLPLQWRIHASLAALYRAQRRHEAAEQAGAAALAVVAELAGTVPEGGLRDNFLTRASALVPVSRPPSALRAAKQRYGGLTARQREVAALIARGLTNRQIAGALLISEETTASHVKQILNRLEATSRTQIAVWAVEAGLAGAATSRTAG